MEGGGGVVWVRWWWWWAASFANAKRGRGLWGKNPKLERAGSVSGAMMRPHTLWTRILDTPWTPAIFPSIFRHISNQYLIDIRYSLVYLDFSTYKRYCMLIAQPLRSITNRIAACFTYSILPTFGLSYHWRLRYFRLYHMAIDYYCDALLKR